MWPWVTGKTTDISFGRQKESMEIFEKHNALYFRKKLSVAILMMKERQAISKGLSQWCQAGRDKVGTTGKGKWDESK